MKIVGHEVREHEAIVERRVPAHQRLIVGAIPEAGDEPPQQQLLREAHLRMRGHLERAQLHEPLPAAARFRRVQLVDAELGAVRVAGAIDQEVAKHAIDQPRRRRSGLGHLRERNLELVQRIVPPLVDARMLAGGAEEETREQEGQRRVVVPVADQAAQEIRSTQKRAVGWR